MSPGFRGRCTAPLLIDKQTMRPVSNESSSIMRMLGKLQLSGCLGVDLYPQHLQQQIDQLNDQVYRAINNGVYRAGFSTSQAGYDAAVGEMHQLMARLDQQLTNQRFLLGDRCTEADLRLFPTICRFDAVYAGIFKYAAPGGARGWAATSPDSIPAYICKTTRIVSCMSSSAMQVPTESFVRFAPTCTSYLFPSTCSASSLQ
eukprot:GHRR01013875.1.p1 GENE.GHRR01013875.1~~GHRR01013875.1.p1  ORF type:complete len:202 (+),score=41.21 GHRR01013875.1:767-1372(+)